MQVLNVRNISQFAGVPFRGMHGQRGINYSCGTPTENTQALLSRRVDCALIPTVDLLKHQELRSLGFGLSCRERSRSMILYSSCPLDMVRTISTYSCSASSKALLRYLCKQSWGINPSIIPGYSLDHRNRMHDREATLVLHESPAIKTGAWQVEIDIATEWFSHTRSYFPFLVWATRDGALCSQQIDLITKWLHRCNAAKETLLKEWSNVVDNNSDSLHAFIAEDREYRLTPRAFNGLDLFLSHASTTCEGFNPRFFSVRKSLFGEIRTSSALY